MQLNVKEESGFRYIEEGSGEPIVLLHGLFGALSNWNHVLDYFKPNYKVLIPLMPIYTMPIVHLGVKGLAEFIHEFIEFKQFHKVTLLGNSLGGHVALVYVTRHPEKVKAMILTGSSGLYEKAFGDTFPKRGDREYIKQKVSLTFYDPEVATDELVDEVLNTTNDRAKVLRILTMAKSAIRHNMRKDIPNIQCPVCLIWGKQDGITPPNVAEEFHALLPDSELHWIDRCSHAAMMERPEEFNDILNGFLLRLKERGVMH
jgi:pimeloyl-ACP methyl ester carboxylesterase